MESLVVALALVVAVLGALSVVHLTVLSVAGLVYRRPDPPAARRQRLLVL